MVILFKGTDKSKNFSPQAIALCAGLSATKFYKKTLVIQLTSKYPVEDYLIGKKKIDQNIDNRAYLFEDSGIDSLVRRVGVASFRQEHFANAVTSVVNSENLLDILDVSKKTEEDFVRELEASPTIVGAIIKAATKIYDNIFVLANGKNPELIKGVIPYMNKTVTCIPQSVKEGISAEATEEHCYLITNFDYKSAYGIRQMSKFYGSNKMFTMPYNVDFKDYYTNNNMLQYILHNISPNQEDYSYHLISEMTKLTEYLLELEEKEDNSLEFSIRTLKRVYDEEYEYYGDNVEISTQPGGLFKRPVTDVHINNNRRKKKETPLDNIKKENVEDMTIENLEEDVEADDFEEVDEVYDDRSSKKKSKRKDNGKREKKRGLFGRKKADKQEIAEESNLMEFEENDEIYADTQNMPKSVVLPAYNKQKEDIQLSRHEKKSFFAKKDKDNAEGPRLMQDAVEDFLNTPTESGSYQKTRKAEVVTLPPVNKEKKNRNKNKSKFKRVEMDNASRKNFEKEQQKHYEQDDDYYFDEEDEEDNPALKRFDKKDTQFDEDFEEFDLNEDE